MKSLTSRYFIIIVLGLMLISVLATKYWLERYYPSQPIFIELVNATDKVIPSVIIEFGNDQLQEKITNVQLRVGEKRILALNHHSGLGFNVQVNYADGEMTEICGGKSAGYRFYRETIIDTGIYTTPIR